MSPFGGKTDMAPASQMFANDPKRTRRAQPRVTQKAIQLIYEGGPCWLV